MPEVLEPEPPIGRWWLLYKITLIYNYFSLIFSNATGILSIMDSHRQPIWQAVTSNFHHHILRRFNDHYVTMVDTDPIADTISSIDDSPSLQSSASNII
jgi:hypothetical protein